MTQKLRPFDASAINALRDAFAKHLSTAPTAVDVTPPFRVLPSGFIADSTDSIVLACDGCGKLYAEDGVAADAWFMCSCGRLGQRMEEATAEQCGIR